MLAGKVYTIFSAAQCTNAFGVARSKYDSGIGSPENVGFPFNFESLGDPEHLAAAPETIRAQKSGGEQACQPWPKDDVDDGDCAQAKCRSPDAEFRERMVNENS